MGGDGGAILLIGGALIGLPHGSTDFVVAARWLRPVYGRSWLPLFVLAYLALAGAVLVAWSVLPLATLCIFVSASGLHFGTEDMEGEAPSWRPLFFAARVTTPLLPIFLFHTAEIGPYLSGLGGMSEAAAVATLAAGKPVLLPLWIGVVAAATIGELWRPDRALSTLRAAELVAIAAAAVVLPPLVAFAVYFCCAHAMRHMAHLTARLHPSAPRQALGLAAAVVAPSAFVCGALLVSSWSVLGGRWPTIDVINGALRLVAALTVPHMLLERLSERPVAKRFIDA